MTPDPTAESDTRSSQPAPAEELTSATVHELLVVLTAIKAHAQLLHRWLRRTGALDADRASAMLESIDHLASRAATRLDGLRRHEPSDGA